MTRDVAAGTGPEYRVTLACGHSSWIDKHAISGQTMCATCGRLVGVSFQQVKP